MFATMNLTRRRILHLAAGAAALPFVSGLARAQSLSDAAGALRRRLSAWRPDRYRRAPDGTMAVRAARSTIRHREPAGCRQQHRHRGGRACATGRLYASCWPIRRTPSTRRSTTSSISISSATSRRSRASCREPLVMVVNPSFPAKTVPEFIAYAKANPGKINFASGGNGTPPHVAGELFKMMTGVNLVHVPYRGGAPAVTDLLGGQVHAMFASASVDRAHQGRQAARAGGDHRDTLGRAAGPADRGRFPVGLRGELVAWHRRAQEHARRDHRQAQQGDQRGPRRSQDQGATCRHG